MTDFGFHLKPDGDIENPRDDEKQFRRARRVKDLTYIDRTRWTNSYHGIHSMKIRYQQEQSESIIEDVWLEMRIGKREAVQIELADLPNFCDRCQQKFPEDELKARKYIRTKASAPETKRLCAKCENAMEGDCTWLDRGDYAWIDGQIVYLGEPSSENRSRYFGEERV
ncbi:hypothetical protein CCAX7_14220 [Capsulimonas corticalis]|uniref:Uncharacterized protein n=1 Tax=Capsulimonas corticalis TaxID=2219043 RepID=A0A402D743_9BACT|nr:hypothetical protein [Capsulimonas corticalis]BDI29371.1 hypothetical protein CCAX7_14220 [Capsulimonas corticalis]